MAGTHAGRVNRPSPWPWLVPVAALVAGTLFASSVRASQGEDLRTDQAQLPDLIRAQNRTNETRAGQLDDLQGKVDEATAALAPGDLRDPAARAPGQRDRHGRRPHRRCAAQPCGSPSTTRKLAGGEVPAGADPDDYVIHQQDVQAVVNALWAGGAEAMMLQDQRVISTSAVRCVGNTLILQGRVYSPPYIITAIGDRDRPARGAGQPTRRSAIYRAVRRRASASATTWQRRHADLPGLRGLASTSSTPRCPPREAASALGGSGLGELLDHARRRAAAVRRLAAVVDRRHRRPHAGRDRSCRPARGTTSPAADAPGARCDGNVIPAAVPLGDAFALIRIPRFGARLRQARPPGHRARPSWPSGVGHYAGTAVPGEVGNFAVAGHRATYGKPFNDIDQLRPGDRDRGRDRGHLVRLPGRPARDRHAQPRRGRRAGAPAAGRRADRGAG